MLGLNYYNIGDSLVWRHPQKTDLEKAAKRWRQDKAVVEASRKTAILSVHETRMQLLTLLRAMWCAESISISGSQSRVRK
jgi:hypothetical protein